MPVTGFDRTTPPGTLLVVADDRRYRWPPAADREVVFGRALDDAQVHVAVGVDDPYVSRRQGVLVCDGRAWRLRNIGRLPIRLVDESMLLAGRELVLASGCTPLLLGAPTHRVHLVEIHVAG